MGEIIVTIAGVVLLYFTLKETRRSSNLAKISADAARKSAEAASNSLDRPWLYIVEVTGFLDESPKTAQTARVKVRIANYGKAPGLIQSFKAVLFFAPPHGEEIAFENAVKPLPRSMRLFPEPSGRAAIINNEGGNPERRLQDLRGAGHFRPINFDDGVLTQQMEEQEFWFRANQTVDASSDVAIPIEYAGRSYLMGTLIYTMPTDEMEIVNFTFEGVSATARFRMYGPKPYNGRHRIGNTQDK